MERVENLGYEVEIEKYKACFVLYYGKQEVDFRFITQEVTLLLCHTRNNTSAYCTGSDTSPLSNGKQYFNLLHRKWHFSFVTRKATLLLYYTRDRYFRFMEGKFPLFHIGKDTPTLPDFRFFCLMYNKEGRFFYVFVLLSKQTLFCKWREMTLESTQAKHAISANESVRCTVKNYCDLQFA